MSLIHILTLLSFEVFSSTYEIARPNSSYFLSSKIIPTHYNLMVYGNPNLFYTLRELEIENVM